ncbi:acid shock protein, partial [Shigella flexneri]
MKKVLALVVAAAMGLSSAAFAAETAWICPYISRHLLSLNPLQA